MEAGSATVAGLFAERGRKVQISRLGYVETQSAFAVKVRSGGLGLEAAAALRARLILDVAAGDVEVYSLTLDHFKVAERLIGRHAFGQRLRTLDAIQLAIALDLRDQDAMDSFVVSDGALSAVAAAEGLSVIVP
ncbi:MAG: type II toxin-antitoxin system VapC family toxin [Bryobacterales bacterium]|nr:type II toxin-antitoxin system VapC family toxin [Bryobacterales bacterium]